MNTIVKKYQTYQKGEAGEVSLTNMLVGIVVFAVIAVGVVATFTTLIPWVQDENARGELVDISISQEQWAQENSSTIVGVNDGKVAANFEELNIGGYSHIKPDPHNASLSADGRICLNSDGTRWVAEIRSDSGKYFTFQSTTGTVKEVSVADILCEEIIKNGPAEEVIAGGETVPPVEEDETPIVPEDEEEEVIPPAEEEDGEPHGEESIKKGFGEAIYPLSDTQVVAYTELVFDWSNQVLEVRNLTVKEESPTANNEDWTIIIDKSVFPYTLAYSVEYSGSWQVSYTEYEDRIEFKNKPNEWAPNNPTLNHGDSFTFSPRFHLHVPVLEPTELSYTAHAPTGSQWWATQEVTIHSTSMLKGSWSVEVDLATLNGVRPLNNAQIQNSHVYGIEHISGTVYRIFSTSEQLWTLPDENTSVTVVIVSG